MIDSDARRIVVLDGHVLNPGDLSWEPLAALGQLQVHPRTPAEAIVERAAGAGVVLTNKTPLSGETISKLPELRYIGVLATGFNVVDVSFAQSRGIVVTNVPSYGSQSVAQMVLALLLELTNQVGWHAERARAGAWSQSPDWCFWDRPLVELAGLTMGIVGYGAIGRLVAELALALGMRVVATRRTPRQERDGEVEFVQMDALFKTSDVISLHCPLTPQTQRLIDARTLELMKPSALLINTARGGLVDEPALAEALNAGRIAGAGLDVLSVEPPPDDNPLLRARNCIVTPHIAWATHAARARLLESAVKNVRAFLDGAPINIVNAANP